MTPSPQTPSPQARPSFRIVDRGSNAAAQDAEVRVATTPAQVQALAALAYGRQSQRPTLGATAGRSTFIGIFLGTRSTGGYSVNVESVSVSGNVLTVTAREKTPGKDMLTTQALTNPWVLIEVPGTYADVRVVGLDRAVRMSPGSEF